MLLALHHGKPDAEFELPFVPRIAMAPKRNMKSQTLRTHPILPSTQQEREHKQIQKEHRSPLKTKHQRGSAFPVYLSTNVTFSE